jgi:hypothetical protein
MEVTNKINDDPFNQIQGELAMYCPIVQQVILPDDGGAQRNVPIACSARMLACLHSPYSP